MKKITLTSLSIASAMTLSSAAIADTNWSGFYGGLSVGYQDALVRDDGFTLNYFGLTGTPNPKNVTGGGFAGYNVQMPGQPVVLGTEIAFDLGGRSDSIGTNGFGASARAKVSNEKSVKGRIGYTGYAGFMPWLSAGFVAASTNYAVNIVPGPFVGNHGTQTDLGITGGIGVDYSFYGPVFARVSYSYSHLGNRNFVRDQPGESFDLHDFKLGVGYKF